MARGVDQFVSSKVVDRLVAEVMRGENTREAVETYPRGLSDRSDNGTRLPSNVIPKMKGGW